MSATAFKFDNTIGALLVGSLLSMALWGIACVQTYDYFQQLDNDDSLLQKLMVTLLLTVDTLGSTMIAHMSYHYMATNYTNPLSLLSRTWSFNSFSMVVGVSSFIIRSMFARRIYKFSNKNKLLTCWIMSVTTADLADSIVLTVKSLNVETSSSTIAKIIYVSFAFGVTADISVAVALCWLLQSAKTGFRRSDSIVNTLMAYVVNTGVLVTLDAIGGMIAYIAMPSNNLVFFAFFVTANKLYVNAYLASLNARFRIRERGQGSNSNSLPISLRRSRRKTTTSFATSSVDKITEGYRSPALAISLHTTVERTVDDVDQNKCPHMV